MGKGNHRIISHSILLWVSVVIVMLTISAPAFCYELNGTATGNLLTGGYAAKTTDFSVSADVENGYALIVEKDGKTFTADGDAQYLSAYAATKSTTPSMESPEKPSCAVTM